MNPDDPREHVLAATHFVLGPSNFLVLRLPPNWDLRIGRNPSDIDYTIPYDGVRWAQEGRATAFLLDEHAHRAMELDVRTARGPIKPPALESVQEAQFSMGGHPATAMLGVIRAGLLRNKAFNVLYVGYRCDDTRRTITLKFTGKSEPAELKGLLPLIAKSRCH